MIKLYLKQAWMLIRQNKLFSSLYVFGTGLAIAMTMIIAIVYYIKIAPIYPEVNRPLTMGLTAVTVKESKENNINSYYSSYAMVKEWFYPLKSAEVVTAIANFHGGGYQVEPVGGGELLPAIVKMTDANFFKVFEFEFLSGKPFSQADFDSGIAHVVVTESMARRIFGTADGVVGRTFKLDFADHKVASVVRDGSYMMKTSYAQIYKPFTCMPKYDARNERSDKTGVYTVYFKVRQAADKQRLYEEVTELLHKYNVSQSEFILDFHGQPDTHWQSVFRSGNRPIDWMRVVKLYGGIILALLLVPALNLSGMISGRMDQRLSEMGVRKAFGASRRMLLNQVLWENLLLTCMGGLVGLIVSWLLLIVSRNWLFSLFESWPGVVPQGIEVNIQPQMLFSPVLFLIAFGVCVVLNLLSAMYPAWRSLRKNIVYSLNEKI